MAVSQVSRLLGKRRKTVGFFHRSSVAVHILETTQKMLNLPKHCLIHNVPTRWNSSYEMVEWYLEQKSAVYSALTERAHKNKDIANLTDHELSIAESGIEIMKPLKMVPTILSTETTPSVSMILPLKNMILESMKQNDDDTPTAREIKQAISENLQTRYFADPGLEDFLNKCTALHPHFKTLPHLDPAYQHRIYEDTLITEVLSTAQQAETRETTEASPSTSSEPNPSTSSEPSPSTSSEPSPSAVTAESEAAPFPPTKRSAMAEIFGLLFKTVKKYQPDLQQQLKDEVYAYMAKECISVDSNPLAWWKAQESVYPNLAKLAKRYLAIPANSVPSERVFSMAGDIVTATRSSLTTENVDKLIFFKKNLKIE
ncbi:E3 SUMO-protein ligase ZBED1-like [Pangasianodon hypophthalmus]|uniref:E3 SUMO-protein ligase ZBED1-like n=1 Tax=Pangasianodon hypophthalmus TaxID=310915 RepID=UPI0023083627|nr:E3 SUMO-protein ligase ZBED1-like [Pangasianodon hypophthalmus]